LKLLKVAKPMHTSPAAGAAVGAESLHVCVRVRPLLDFELRRGDEEVASVPPEGPSGAVHAMVGAPSGKTMLQRFGFDRSFGPAMTQEELWASSGVSQLVDAALGGYRCTVFAYGQTGSGKTFTMSGNEADLSSRNEAHLVENGLAPSDGLVPRALTHMYARVRARAAASGESVVVRASYCEVYNEHVYDLLVPGDALPVRWTQSQGFFVQGLCVVECGGLEDALAVMLQGQRSRSIGSHELNKDSSRSHAMLTLRIEVDGQPSGRMCFTDLAGSERLKDTRGAKWMAGGSAAEYDAGGKRAEREATMLKETSNINRSLMTLGKVIAALSSRGGGGGASRGRSRGRSRGGGGGGGGGDCDVGHVPFRDSVLTKLLKEALSGNSRTLMIACISPSTAYIDETLSTLQYATRASGVSTRPAPEVIDPLLRELMLLRNELRLEKLRNKDLRVLVRQRKHARGGSPAAAAAAAAPAMSSVAAPAARRALRGLQQQPEGEEGWRARALAAEEQCRKLEGRLEHLETIFLGSDLLGGAAQRASPVRGIRMGAPLLSPLHAAGDVGGGFGGAALLRRSKATTTARGADADADAAALEAEREDALSFLRASPSSAARSQREQQQLRRARVDHERASFGASPSPLLELELGLRRGSASASHQGSSDDAEGEAEEYDSYAADDDDTADATLAAALAGSLDFDAGASIDADSMDELIPPPPATVVRGAVKQHGTQQQLRWGVDVPARESSSDSASLGFGVGVGVGRSTGVGGSGGLRFDGAGAAGVGARPSSGSSIGSALRSGGRISLEPGGRVRVRRVAVDDER
jgi:hypothetical protein